MSPPTNRPRRRTLRPNRPEAQHRRHNFRNAFRDGYWTPGAYNQSIKIDFIQERNPLQMEGAMTAQLIFSALNIVFLAAAFGLLAFAFGMMLWQLVSLARGHLPRG